MEKITYKEIFNTIFFNFGIKLELKKISKTVLMVNFTSIKYKHIWLDRNNLGKDKLDHIYIKYDQTEDIDTIIYDVLFNFIKTYEKYYLMCDKKDENDVLFIIPYFNSPEELAIKMEMIEVK